MGVEDRAFVENALGEKGHAVHPFHGTAEAHDPERASGRACQPSTVPENPQTTHVLALVGRAFNLGKGSGGGEGSAGAEGVPALGENPEELDLGDMDEVVPEGGFATVENEEEIPLED